MSKLSTLPTDPLRLLFSFPPTLEAGGLCQAPSLVLTPFSALITPHCLFPTTIIVELVDHQPFPPQLISFHPPFRLNDYIFSHVVSNI